MSAHSESQSFEKPTSLGIFIIFILSSIALIVTLKTLGLFIVLALCGVPLFVIMGGGAAIAWLLMHDPSRQYVRFIAGDVLQEKFAGSPILVTIPLFTFVGYLMAESKTPERIIRVSQACLGWVPGGLALVCIIASAFFTTLTGASGVTIIAIGGLLYPALRKQKYPDSFSLGLVTTGGSLGLLLPPSLPILVYSLVAAIPVQQMFKAAFIPGVLVMLVLAAYSAYIAIREKIPRTRFEPREVAASLWLIKWELCIPILILGGLLTGLTSLDECAALTAFYTLIIEIFVYKDLSIKKDLPRIVQNSMSLAGAIILILAMANSLINYIDFVHIPKHILEWLETHSSLNTSWKFLIGLNLFLLIIGMLMDGFSAILVAVPLIIPIATTFRMNPFHLGIIFLLNLEIAYLCPPLGLNLYISSFRFQRPVVSLYRIAFSFVGLLLIVLGIITYVPKFSVTLLQAQIDAEHNNDLEAIKQCERPKFDYDQLSCVQSDPLNRKPCDARSERLHCLTATHNQASNFEYQFYCIQAYEKSCIRTLYKQDGSVNHACSGKPWSQQWIEHHQYCESKLGLAKPTVQSATSTQANSDGVDPELLNQILGTTPSISTSTTRTPHINAEGVDEDLLKDITK